MNDDCSSLYIQKKEYSIFTSSFLARLHYKKLNSERKGIKYQVYKPVFFLEISSQ